MINVKLLDMDVGVPCYSHLHKNGVETAAVLGITMTAIGLIASADAQNVANDQNARLHQQDLDYDKWKFQETMNANKMTSQRADFEAAGYSPYAALGNAVNYGATSTPTGSPMQSTINPGMFDTLANQLYSFERMKSDVGKTIAESARTDAETQNLKAQNTYAFQYYKAQAEQQMQQALATGQDYKFKQIQNQLQQDSFQYQVDQFALNNKLTKAQIESVSADASLTAWHALSAQKEYSWIDKIKSAQLDETLARIATEYTKQELNREQATAAIASAFQMNSQGKLNQSQYNRLEATAKDYAAEMFANRALAEWKAIGAQNDAMNNYQPWSAEVWQNRNNHMSAPLRHRRFMDYISHGLKSLSPLK